MNQLEIKAYYPVMMDVCINIYNIIHDFDDKIEFAWDVCGKKKRTCYSKIRYDKEGRSYFNSYSNKIYLDECVCVDY